MSAPTWAKVLGVGGFALGVAGIAALVIKGDDEESGTVPPDDIEEDDDLDEDDDTIPVEPETVPGIFEK